MISNDTHGTFDDILAAAKPPLRLVCKALRSLIASSDKRFVEVVWPRQKIASFGVGPKKKTEHYAYIGVQGMLSSTPTRPLPRSSHLTLSRITRTVPEAGRLVSERPVGPSSCR